MSVRTRLVFEEHIGEVVTWRVILHSDSPSKAHILNVFKVKFSHLLGAVELVPTIFTLAKNNLWAVQGALLIFVFEYLVSSKRWKEVKSVFAFFPLFIFLCRTRTTSSFLIGSLSSACCASTAFFYFFILLLQFLLGFNCLLREELDVHFLYSQTCLVFLP